MTAPPDLSATLSVRVIPRSAREGIAGYSEGIVRIRLNAPPVAGRANEALARYLAKALGVPRGRVTLVSGITGRSKIVRIAGITREAALAALGIPMAGELQCNATERAGPSGGGPRSPRTGCR